MVKPCDRIWEVDALREGRLGGSDVESFERHRAICAACDVRFREDERLRVLGRSLTVPRVDALDARRRRAALLRDVATVRGASKGGLRIAVVAAACAVAACVVAIAFGPHSRDVVLRATPSVAAAVPAPALAATVRSSQGAIWSQRRDGDVETVTLDTGTLVVEVRRQREGERFLVALPDGEIEVRGTIFEVTAGGGRTLAIDVREGLVALRRRGHGETLLGAGESWPPSTATLPATSASVAASRALALAPSGAASALPSSAAPPAASSAARSGYDDAMRAYRARRYEEAARAFRAFVAAHPSAPEAEDAAFLEAASLAFAGRADAAAFLAERFLERYPRSFHARDAAILVARVARDRGDCARALHVLAPWASSDSPDVRAALGACAR